MARHSGVVLVTGCSSGIGAALCAEFHRRGLEVVATARRVDSLAALAERGMLTEQLDVTDGESVRRCVASVEERLGRVDILVNNAGYGLMGPAVALTDDQLRAQFDTNVVAPLALTRAIAPMMRANGGGTVVMIGSISGVVTTPFSGGYCASKAALHALCDALRVELRPFGIRVVTVQPGSIRSGFGAAATATAMQTIAADDWYEAVRERIVERANMSQADATPADEFARDLVARLLSGHPSARIRLGKKSRVGPLVERIVPTALLDRILARRFGLDALGAAKKRADD